MRLWATTRRALIGAGIAAALLPAVPAWAGYTPRIVQPEPTIEPVPWQVALFDKTTGALFCGGTLRDEKHVITAAHCLLPEDGPGTIEVVAGIAGRSDADAPDAERRPVAAVSSFPDYDGNRGDAAVLVLQDDIEAEDGIAHLNVVDPGEDVNGAAAIISGFGANVEGGRGSDSLRHAFVDVLPDSTCADESAYGTDYDAATMMCAGRRSEHADTWVDACQGDSGGPLARRPDTAIETEITADALLGIVSFGIGCGRPEHPGVYTDLTHPDINTYVTGDVGQRPLLVEDPRIEGSPTGATLTCVPGRWDHAARAVRSYRWERGRFIGRDWVGTPIVGATTTSYAPVPGDEGQRIACIERVRTDFGAAEELDTVMVAAPPVDGTTPPPPPVEITIPSIDARPLSSLARRSCKKGRCAVTLAVTDADGLRGMRVAATLQRTTGCRTRAQRRTKACRKLALRARRVASGRFSVVTRKLRPGTYRLTVIAKDATGLTQLRPTILTLRVKR